MDACEFVGVVKPEDNAGIMKVKLGCLKCVAKVFRVVEFCFVLLLLLWISTRLPFAVRISGEYFRQLVGVILSPIFVFILCNFIVLILLFKFRSHSDNTSMFHNVAGAEVYSSLLENAEFSTNISFGISSLETVYEDKQTIFEESAVINHESFGPEEMETVMNSAFTHSEKLNKGNREEIFVKLMRSETEKCRKVSNSGDISTEKCRKVTNSDDVLPETLMKLNIPRRTQSVKVNLENKEEEISVKLQRSETEKCRKVTNPGEFPPESVHEVDELSNEEFQKAIENFIAKQTKFHQQEKLAIILHSQA
ncbi:hypothetical protein FXO38_30115 [Capsicum annuum]|uniref:DUF4408 domain-containing protein n=1 Tax=Capsicum annuum TaxID=4072 RepID=A0A1U8H7J3_CAPAN|nr:hypothetical protein FXO38_30115 [Capsicum annuum]KAF3652928.1 hypothetical protein FXO37_17257 [Capsicum annuum]PHT83157.1 hypothetical protein T459_11600 [Capsicum annuum]